MRSLRGKLLVASPRMGEGNFRGTVVLIIQHDEQGAFGLVLNRPTEHTLAEIWESVSDQGHSRQPLNAGGPVPGPIMALHTRDDCSEREVIPGVHFAVHKDQLNRVVQEGDGPIRVFHGYSGWTAGQLEQELEAGGWMTLPATREAVFADPDFLWLHAVREVGEGITRPLLGRVPLPNDPRMN